MAEEQNPNILTIKEASALLRIHPETLRRAIRSGELKAARLGHRTVRIAKVDLEAWFRDKGGSGDQLFGLKTGRPPRKTPAKKTMLRKDQGKKAVEKPALTPA